MGSSNSKRPTQALAAPSPQKPGKPARKKTFTLAETLGAQLKIAQGSMSDEDMALARGETIRMPSVRADEPEITDPHPSDQQEERPAAVIESELGDNNHHNDDLIFADRSPERPDERSDERSSTRPDVRAVVRPVDRTDGQPGNRTTGQVDNRVDNRTTGQPDERVDNRTTGQPDERVDNRTSGQPDNRATGRAGGQPDERVDNRAFGQPDMSRLGTPSDSFMYQWGHIFSNPRQAKIAYHFYLQRELRGSQEFLAETIGVPYATLRKTLKKFEHVGLLLSWDNITAQGLRGKCYRWNDAPDAGQVDEWTTGWTTGQPGGQPGSRIGGQPGNRTSGQPGGQPGNRATGQPGGQPDRRATGRAGGQPGNRTSGQPGGQPDERTTPILDQDRQKESIYPRSGEDSGVRNQLLALKTPDVEFFWPNLQRLGFGQDQIAQIVGKLDLVGKSCDRILMALDYIEFELEHDLARDKNGEKYGIGYFFNGLAKNGYWRKPEGYKTPDEVALEEQVEEAKRMEELRNQLKAQQKANEEAQFQEWKNALSDSEKANILAERKAKKSGTPEPENLSLKFYWLENFKPS